LIFNGADSREILPRTLTVSPATKADFAAIVLAAGKGTRMKSAKPKVMHPVAGRPMIIHVLGALEALRPARTVVVLAPGMDEVAELVRPAEVAIQEEQLGTGHAAASARHAFDGAEVADFLILAGDTPLLRTESLQRLLEARRARRAAVAVLGMRPPEPGAYGRLVTGADDALEAIVEAKDCSREQLQIPLCNAGVLAVDGERLFPLLDKLGRGNAQGEYYLTDVVALARAEGLSATVVEAPDAAGINSRAELAAVEAAMQDRLRQAAMAGGATLTSPETVFFSADTKLGRDVTVGPFTVFGPGCTVEDGVEILGFCHFREAHIAKNAIVGPYSRLRPGAEIGEDAHIGNFVEVKASKIGKGAKANHLAYLGDSEVGAKANVGAGTITCNYDGYFKQKTIIGEGAFIGTNASLVAPVTIGKGAYVAAGSVVTMSVSDDALAVGRGQQVEKKGWARDFRERRAAEKARVSKK
jgi:bifunctional UDP-N-acetylglucosamine pyrophosphorylase/glucosamine-1-phosphate N-acetyltransferase